MKSLIIAALVFGCVSAFASTEPSFIWDNLKTFVPADGRCQVEPQPWIRFRISGTQTSKRPYEDIQDSHGRHYGYVLEHSLVKYLSALNSKERYIEVVGVNPNRSLNTRRGFLDRLGRGYVRDQNLSTLDNYLIEIGDNAPAEKIGDSNLPLRGSLWLVESAGNGYLDYTCRFGGHDYHYTIFDVFEPNQADPVARVGVNWDDTKIFRSIRVLPMSADKKQKIANTKPSEQKAKTVAVSPVSTIDTSSSAPATSEKPVVFVPVPMSSARPDSAAQIQQASQSVQSPDEVICSDGSVNVRDVRSGRVIFQADGSESVRVIKSNALSRVIDGKKYALDEVEFPARRGRNKGLVVSDFVQTKNACEAQKQAPSASVQQQPEIQYVICPPEGSINVHAHNLRRVLFKADRLEDVKLIDPMSSSGISKVIDGQRYHFIEVEFPARSSRQNRGWVAKDMIEPKASCEGSKSSSPSKNSTSSDSKSKSSTVTHSSSGLDILKPNCAKEKILESAKSIVRRVFGNRPHSHGKCAKGVRLSLQHSRVGGISSGLGNAVDYLAKLKEYGYVSTGITSVAAAPAGAILIFSGPYTKSYFRNGHYGHPPGNWLGHVTIKGDDGYYYTDGRTRDPAIGWYHGRNVAHIRNLVGVYVPGDRLVKEYVGKCKGL